jgi:hypothetical protein
MVLSGQPLHAMATFTPGKELPLPIEQSASWALGQVLRLTEERKFLPPTYTPATIFFALV